jgi:hypothetical protein
VLVAALVPSAASAQPVEADRLTGRSHPVGAPLAAPASRTALVRPVPERLPAPAGLSSELASLAHDAIAERALARHPSLDREADALAAPGDLIASGRGPRLRVAVSIHLAPPAATAADASRSDAAAPVTSAAAPVANAAAPTSGAAAPTSGAALPLVSAAASSAPTAATDSSAVAPTFGAVASTVQHLDGRILSTGPGFVEADVPADRLLDLASTPGVARVAPIRRPLYSATIGAGVALHGADVWQAAGYSGQGVRIGVVDEGFTGLGERLATEFPGGVQVRCYTDVGTFSSSVSDCENGEPHGTAVAETIADMAPGAVLYLADPISFGDVQSTVAWMTSQGVKVINASFGSGDVFEGPGDGTSPYPDSFYRPIDQAVNGGALWVNAAGNSGDLGWTGAWTDANGDGWLEFSGADQADHLTLEEGEHVAIAVRWDEAWGASANDYDLFLFESGGTQPIASSSDVQSGTGDPVERIDFTAPSSGVYDIQISKHPGAAPKTLQLLVEGASQGLSYEVPSGTLPSPADSRNPGMVSVGAVSVLTPDAVEPYSSRGPTTDGRTKPDLVAGDCGQTTIYQPFCGTSQSTPHAAGAAALLYQAQPTLDPAGLAAALRAHTVPIGPLPNDDAGWGRIALGPAPTVPPPPIPASIAPGPPPLGVKAISSASVASAWRAMATGANGQVHFVMTQLDEGIDSVLYRRSIDGGGSAATGLPLSNPGAESGWAAVAGDGARVEAVWLEGDLPGVGPVAVWRRGSADGGATWSSPASLSPLEGRAGDPSVAVDAAGRVAVAWTDGLTGKVVLASSADGVSFAPPTVIGSTTISPFTSAADLDAMPAVAFGPSGRLYVAWSAGESKVAFRRSLDGGATWEPATSVDRLADGYSRPWVAAYGSGVAIGYAARGSTSGASAVFVRRSGDGGLSFAQRRLVAASTATASFAPAVVVRGAVVRVAYAQCTTSACTRARLWYRQSSTYGATWSTATALTGAGTYAWPVGLSVPSRILVAYESALSFGAARGTIYLRTR